MAKSVPVANAEIGQAGTCVYAYTWLRRPQHYVSPR